MNRMQPSDVKYCPFCASEVQLDDPRDPMGDEHFNCPQHGHILIETFDY